MPNYIILDPNKIILYLFCTIIFNLVPRRHYITHYITSKKSIYNNINRNRVMPNLVFKPRQFPHETGSRSIKKKLNPVIISISYGDVLQDMLIINFIIKYCNLFFAIIFLLIYTMWLRHSPSFIIF